MKATEIINKIKGIVGVELADETVKLAEEKLENGTILVAEEFKEGEAVFIKSDDEQIALPVGEYILEDSRVLVVKEEGLIADVREVSDDVPAEEEVEAKEELAEGDEADVRDWDGMEKRIKNLEIAVAKLKEAKEGGDTEVEASEEVKEEIKEDTTELSEEVKEEVQEVELATVKEELVEPIKHNPETKEKVNLGRKISPKKQNTILDSVFSRISKNNNK
tara:strand:- start:756 stop:1415 length:660 start_codon:yes stop_codon:yes gene_type:complete